MTIRDTFRRWLGRRPSHAVILVPCAEFGAKDPVPVIRRFLNGYRTRRSLVIVHLPCVREHIVEVFREHWIASAPKKLLWFAHPLVEASGFRCNPSPTNPRTALLLEFWNHNDRRYKTCLAHVCHGATILQRELWTGVFPHWVSYDGDIRTFTAFRRGETLWKDTIVAIVAAFHKSNTPAALKSRLQSVYLNAMGDLEDSYNAEGGDAINLMYFEACITHLVSSDDHER
jgi:hypothetical protein